jgi:LmbE family N-acetylglucosaminyl deacetylase
MSVLVVAAHPDDEVLGCGATISRLANEGNDVFIAILGEGVTSRSDTGTEGVLKLKEKAIEVAALLGAKEVFTFDFPDNRFDTVALLDIVKQIEELIKKLSPEVVFTHHGGDLNIDHVITHRAVLTATRPLEGSSVKEVYVFEVPSSTEWAFGSFGSFNPDVFFDASVGIECKLKAMEIYDSEARESPHPRSPEILRAISRRWGSAVALEYAEAFETIRRIV